MARKKIVRIPGVSFSWKRALGITQQNRNLPVKPEYQHPRLDWSVNWEKLYLKSYLANNY